MFNPEQKITKKLYTVIEVEECDTIVTERMTSIGIFNFHFPPQIFQEVFIKNYEFLHVNLNS